MDQAVAVKEIMDKAGMVKAINFFLAFLSQDKAAACGDPVARAWTAIRDKPHVEAVPSCYLLLARMRETEQMENTLNGPLPLLPSRAIPILTAS